MKESDLRKIKSSVRAYLIGSALTDINELDGPIYVEVLGMGEDREVPENDFGLEGPKRSAMGHFLFYRLEEYDSTPSLTISLKEDGSFVVLRKARIWYDKEIIVPDSPLYEDLKYIYLFTIWCAEYAPPMPHGTRGISFTI